MAPFFSIITPTYNRAKLIDKAINSVLQQTYTNWELLVVDDGSTDNTRQIVEAYTDKRVKYIYQVNSERSAARNNGIAHSSGQYVTFLDSDDYYQPNRLELLHGAILASKVKEAVFHTGIVYDTDGVLLPKPELKNTFGNIYDYISHAAIGNPQTCIARNILLKHKFNPQFYIGEDMELWLRICSEYPFLYLDDQFTAVAVQHIGRSINITQSNSSFEQLRMLRYVFAPPHPGANISKTVRSFLIGSCYFGIAKYYVYKSQRIAAIVAIARSVISDLQSTQLKFRINVLLKLVTFSSMARVQKLIEY